MLNNKSILITGGTGSFGKRFIEIILENYDPKRVIVYSRDEFKQDLMKKNFKEKFPEKSSKLRFFIGDVRDRDRLHRAFNGVDYVIHGGGNETSACL